MNTNCNNQTFTRDQLLEIVQKAFKAGFLCGHQSGHEQATAADWGTFAELPQTPEEAWEYHIQFRLDDQSSYYLDIADVNSWDNVII